MTSTRLLLTGGYLLDPSSMVVKKKEVLVNKDKIEAIDSSISAPDATRIDTKGMIVMPGLVNSHIHLWQSGLHGIAGNWTLLDYFDKMLDSLGSQYTPEDMYYANLLGALEQIDAGVTCVLDWCNNINSEMHAERALAGLKETGIRGVFAYGPPGIEAEKWWFNSSERHPPDAIQFYRDHFDHSDNLIHMALALRGPDSTQDQALFHDLAMARELGILASMHIGVRTAKFGVNKIHQAGLLNEHINFVHANQLATEEYKLIVDHGASISVTPEVEMQMGMGFPATGKILAAGGVPIIGTDVASNIGGDLFTQLRFAIQTQRALDNQKILDGGNMIDQIKLKYDYALDWITHKSAQALNLHQKVGKLLPGMQADLILIDTHDINVWPVHNPYESVLFYTHRHNIDSVMVNGRFLKRHGKLIYPGLAKLKERVLESSTRILHDAKILDLADRYHKD